MSLAKQALTYLVLIIPTLFAVAFFAQGVTKMSRNEKDGAVILGFGVFLFIAIAAAYFLFIR